MRKYLAILMLFTGLALPVVSLSGNVSASTQDFTITSFTADYYLKRDAQKVSSLDVKEVIVAEFPNFDQNHGILRSIPKTYQDHTVSLQIKSVANELGQAYNYSSTDQNDNRVLKIGDATKFVQGTTTYVIEYSLRNVISFPKDNSNANEFYWDVNGVEWPQSVGQVSAQLHIPSELSSELTGKQVCYAGLQGQNNRDCRVERVDLDTETLINASSQGLNSYENLSLVTEFKDDTFIMGPEIAAEKQRFLLLVITMLVTSLVLPVITFIVCFRKWQREGRDPKGKGVIIPEYVPPKKLNVLSSSFVLNQTFAPKAASAGIIELAVQGLLRINVIEKKKLFGKATEYEVEVMKDISHLESEQQLILDALFDGAITKGSKTNISTQQNKLFSTITKVNDNLAASLTTKGYFSSDPTKARKRFTTAGIIMIVLGFFLFILLPLSVGLFISAAIAFTFSTLMPSRTPLGVETRDYLQGLKDYIKMAEADRLAYLQSPQGAEKTPIDGKDPKQMVKLFESLLPYAMLFGLEKEWAKEFEGLYSQPPNWYNGNVSTFNAIALGNAVSGFSSANSVAFTSPSSSGSSGFGGGGSSGGGGGGGGGGGW